MELRNFNTMKSFLDYLFFEKDVDNILKRYGLNKSIVKLLIHPYYTNLEPILIAQAHGLHFSVIKGYYKTFGRMLESEFNMLLRYFADEVLDVK